MEDVAGFVLVEDADSRRFRAGEFHEIKVVFDPAFGQLLGSDAVVIVEITPVGRNPIKLPSQAVLEGFDFGPGRSGNCRERDVALRKMRQRSVCYDPC